MTSQIPTRSSSAAVISYSSSSVRRKPIGCFFGGSGGASSLWMCSEEDANLLVVLGHSASEFFVRRKYAAHFNGHVLDGDDALGLRLGRAPLCPAQPAKSTSRAAATLRVILLQGQVPGPRQTCPLPADAVQLLASRVRSLLKEKRERNLLHDSYRLLREGHELKQQL